MKFLAFDIDFDDLSLDFLGLRKPANKGIKEVVILPLLASLL